MIQTNLFQHHFIPAKKKSDQLMIVLHGKGDSLKPFKYFDDELKIQNMNYLLLNAPKKFMTGYSWYGEPPFQRQGVLKIREQLFRLLTELEDQGWNPSQIFLLGFSQGCLVSTDFALHYPKKLAGVIGISGYFNFEPRWKKYVSEQSTNIPWLLTHGHKDDVLPIDDTKFGVEKLKEIGLKIDWVESNKAHTFEEEEYPIIRKWVEAKMGRG